MPASRHRDVPASAVNLHGRTVGTSNATSLSDIRIAKDVQAFAGRGHLYVGGARVTDDGCCPWDELPSDAVAAMVEVNADDVVDVGKDETQPNAGC